MRPKHFCAMARGHEVNEHFQPFDFRYWYDEKEDRITPILHKIFFCDGGFTPVLLGSGRTWNDRGGDGPVKMAVAEKVYRCTRNLPLTQKIFQAVPFLKNISRVYLCSVKR